jgi:hypothetical protein
MEGRNISDGRWEIYVAQKAAYEALGEIPKDLVLELPTECAGRQADRCGDSIFALISRRRFATFDSSFADPSKEDRFSACL